MPVSHGRTSGCANTAQFGGGKLLLKRCENITQNKHGLRLLSIGISTIYDVNTLPGKGVESK